MPLYTFSCKNCGLTKDYLVSFGTNEVECSDCKDKAEKQMSYKFAAHGLPNGHNTRRGGIKN